MYDPFGLVRRQFADSGYEYNASQSVDVDSSARRVAGNPLYLPESKCGVIFGIGLEWMEYHCLLEAMLGYLEMVPMTGAQYINGQNSLEALWRTMIADQEDGKVPAPEQFERRYHQALCYSGAREHDF